MEINLENTNTNIIPDKEKNHNINIDRERIEQVKRFNYIGTIIDEKEALNKEINETIWNTGKLYNTLKTMFFEMIKEPNHIKTEFYKKGDHHSSMEENRR